MAIHMPGHGVISDSSTQTDAAIDTVHADTGSIPSNQGSNYQVIATVGGSIASLWDVEHRNVANTVNVDAYRVRVVAGETLQFVLWLNLAAGERARIVNKTDFGLTDTSEATIQVMRLK